MWWTKVLLLFKSFSPLLIEYLMALVQTSFERVLPVAYDVVIAIERADGFANKKEAAFARIRAAFPDMEAVEDAVINDAVEAAVRLMKNRGLEVRRLPAAN